MAAAAPPLERRIRVLTGAEPNPGMRGGASLLASGITIGGLVLLLPQPSAPSVEWSLPAAEALPAPPPVALAAGPRDTSRPQLLNRHQAPEILDEVYPAVLLRAGIGGTIVAWIYVDERGLVDRSLVLESSGHEELDEAASLALRRFRYRPAIRLGRPAAVWAQQSVSFLPPPPTPPGQMRFPIWRSATQTLAAQVPER